jgi:hypothetical protein
MSPARIDAAATELLHMVAQRMPDAMQRLHVMERLGAVLELVAGVKAKA